jgi:hypothetical protein
VDTPDLLLHNNGRENGSDRSYGSQSLTCSWRLRWQGSGQRRPGASARRVKVKERPGAMLAYPSPEGGTPRGASATSAVDSKRIRRTRLAAPVSWVRESLGQPTLRLMGTDGGRSVRRRRGGFSPTTSPAETLIPSAPIDSRPVRGTCTPEAGQPAMPVPSASRVLSRTRPSCSCSRTPRSSESAFVGRSSRA